MEYLANQPVCTIHDQNAAVRPRGGREIYAVDPMAAWGLSREEAELWIANRPNGNWDIQDASADLVRLDDGTLRMVHRDNQVDAEAEKQAARERVLAKLPPEERSLFAVA